MKKRRSSHSAEESRLQLENERSQIARAEAELMTAVERHGYPQAAIFALRLAFEEAVINAFRHGHKLIPDRPIEVSWKVEDESVRITVADQGPGFDPSSIPDPTLEENLEKPSGRGIMLMRGYMTRIAYNASGNQVSMEYRRPATDKSRAKRA